MKLNKQNKIIVGVLAFLLTLTVGYAVFSQSLNITGTAKAEGNFSLIFEKDEENNPKCDGYSNECNIDNLSSISADKKTLNITVDKLNYPTAYVQIPVKIKNEGSIDALLEKIEVNGLSNDDIEVTYSITDEEIKKGYVIKANESKNMTVKVLWKEDFTNANPETLNFTITLKYVQYTNSLADSGSNVTNNCTEFTKKDTYSVGDVIAFCNTNTGKSEDFYVISDNGTTVTALAKYNLMVGYSHDTVTGETELIPENKEDYGLQSDKTLVDEKNEMTVSTEYGLIHFANPDENHKTSSGSYLGYWADSNGNLLNDYKKTDTSTYPIDVYDNNSNLYIPLQNYKEYLENLNVSINEIRPITYAELIDLGCNEVSCSTAETSELKDKETQRKWLFEGYNYWTSTANFHLVKAVDGTWLDNPGFAEGVGWGLRPVIEINKSEI